MIAARSYCHILLYSMAFFAQELFSLQEIRLCYDFFLRTFLFRLILIFQFGLRRIERHPLYLLVELKALCSTYTYFTFYAGFTWAFVSKRHLFSQSYVDTVDKRRCKMGGKIAQNEQNPDKRYYCK